MNTKSQAFRPQALPRAHDIRLQAIALTAVLLMGALLAPGPLRAAELQAAAVRADAAAAAARFDGEVQAVRQAELAAQVAGSVTELNVRAGDAVRAGQVLLRIDARAAEQAAAASGAQVAAAQAQLDVATRELARKRELAAKKYISQGALEQAESQHRAAQAQVRALSSQAGAARTQTAFHVLRAPFDGVVARLVVEQGDMAMPGRPLLTVYDPAALRVSAHVPASVLKGGADGVRVWLAGTDAELVPSSVQVLPTVDARSLTQEVRATLPAGSQAVPGQFARLQLAGAAATGPQRLFVPASAVVRRAEVTGVYVLDAQQQPRLRQVRLGPVQGSEVEVLAGLDAGEHVAADPAAATRAAVRAASQ
ncbi:MAG TPA: efflux RND transporter periplasmic adaptor subunit [Ottowia sp.]|uniref:efflux RND transporter periplasmic adaptor subunit n=1 Tax=Ottowia sp. TaxID=1898956 RepID=UPI002C39A108|nr:efflux RND transporter periplasmic adaptor subunit [Ottowia sp.]HMN20638.1 efflux RND transporter periplasmic adaptor subunit [Ottowia sp.]